MRYLLWDFDHTLAYRPGMWSQCLANLATRADRNRNYSREDFLPYLTTGFPWHSPTLAHLELNDGDSWWRNLTLVFKHAFIKGGGFKPEVAASLATLVRTEYLDPEGWKIYPDVHDELTMAVSQGWKNIILSNHVPELPTLVEQLGLSSYFDRVISSATIGYEKPHPGAFQAATQHIPAGSRIVMIGDSLCADYNGAIQVGLEAVLVRATHAKSEFMLESLAGVVAFLNST